MADDSNKVDIKVNADANNAVFGISRIISGLKTLRTAVTGVMRTLGMINWAVQAVQMLYSGYQKLCEWMGRAAKEARELADQLERDSIATAAAHAAEAYKKLNKELAEANRLEKERNAILDQRKSTTRDLEDASLERDKQVEISKLDTSSATYEEDRRAIERKYERRASKMSTARADEDTRAGARRLYDEAETKDRQANALQAEYDKQMQIANRSRERVWRLGMDERRGVEGAKEKHDEAEQQWKRDEEAAQKTKEAMEALRKEAEAIRARAAEMTGGNRAARIRDEARQAQISNEERGEEARKKKTEREAAEREKEQRQKEQEREVERQEREKAQRQKEQERERIVRENHERTEKISMFSRMETAAVSADSVSQNRLTAMGLGSGVSAQGSGVANDVSGRRSRQPRA